MTKSAETSENNTLIPTQSTIPPIEEQAEEAKKLTETIRLSQEQREKEIRATHLEYGNARLTPITREKFLQKLRETGNVSLSAALVGVSRRRAYQLKMKDKEFSDLWDEAREIGLDNV